MTIGDLTLGMIGTARIRLDYKGDTIDGIVHDIRTDTTTVITETLLNGHRFKRGDKIVRVKIAFKNFVVAGLLLDHPCEVIA